MNEKVKEITDMLEKGMTELFEGENFKRYLQCMSQFHTYSYNNQILIFLQKPDASLVAGYTTWAKKFERHVKAGERAIKIFAPCVKKVTKETEDVVILNNDGLPVSKEDEHEKVITTYRVVSVFDISQTEGKDLPVLGVNELGGTVAGYSELLDTLKEIAPVPVIFDDSRLGNAKGCYFLYDKVIHVRPGMSEVQTIKTLIHEITHSLLHSNVKERLDRRTEEVEAESVAFCVSQYLGFDTSDYSFGYIAGWSSGKDAKELRSSLERIRGTVKQFIDELNVGKEDSCKPQSA